MVCIGIDVGNNGAIAAIRNDGGIIGIYDMPTKTEIKNGKKQTSLDEHAFRGVLDDYRNDHVHIAIEAVHSMPKDGGVSGFKFGVSFGLCRGIVIGLGMDYELVTPQKWKRCFNLLKTEKKQSCYKAMEFFPNAELFTPRGRALDGRGDALLIAEYLRQHHICNLTNKI